MTMFMKFASNDEAVKVAKRALFLAYKASDVLGMGILQARSEVTEEQVFANAVTKADYPGSRQMPDLMDTRIYADYVFGRMMKLVFTIKNSTVEYPDTPTKMDYQSWSHKSGYKTYDKLFLAACKELKITASNVKELNGI